MKKPLIVAFVSLSFAAPVFACPEHDEAPRTAQKKEATEEKAPATTADKAKDAKPADKAKAAKPAQKTNDAKPDKVSQK
jgi:hypothetical protein